MSGIDNVTINDLWSYISNKIASKVNDPFDELNGILIPIGKDGSFGTPKYSDEYENVYDWISHLCQNTHEFETPSFGFMIPGWKRDIETNERAGQIITFVLVKSYDKMQVGVWDLQTNEVIMADEREAEDAHGDGPLPMSLGALSVGIEIEHGGMGEAGKLMREAKAMVMRGNELAAKAFEMLRTETNR